MTEVKIDVAPCHQDIFAIRLMLEAVEEGQTDFGFGDPVGFQLFRKQPNLLSQLGYGLGSLCPGDLYITEGYRNIQTVKSQSDAYFVKKKKKRKGKARLLVPWHR